MCQICLMSYISFFLHFSILGVPLGEVDYLAIIENGNDFTSLLSPDYPTIVEESNSKRQRQLAENEGADDEIFPGLGWGLATRVINT